MDTQSIETFLRTTATELALKVLAAIAFWVIGRWLIGRVLSLLQAAMNRNEIDPTLTKYLGSIVAVAPSWARTPTARARSNRIWSNVARRTW